MTERVRITFRYALGARVRVYRDPRCWVVAARTYHEGTVSRWVQYSLALDGPARDDGSRDGCREYEVDLEPWEDDPHA